MQIQTACKSQSSNQIKYMPFKSAKQEMTNSIEYISQIGTNNTDSQSSLNAHEIQQPVVLNDIVPTLPSKVYENCQRTARVILLTQLEKLVFKDKKLKSQFSKILSQYIPKKADSESSSQYTNKKGYYQSLHYSRVRIGQRQFTKNILLNNIFRQKFQSIFSNRSYQKCYKARKNQRSQVTFDQRNKIIYLILKDHYQTFKAHFSKVVQNDPAYEPILKSVVMQKSQKNQKIERKLKRNKTERLQKEEKPQEEQKNQSPIIQKPIENCEPEVRVQTIQNTERYQEYPGNQGYSGYPENNPQYEHFLSYQSMRQSLEYSRKIFMQQMQRMHQYMLSFYYNPVIPIPLSPSQYENYQKSRTYPK